LKDSKEHDMSNKINDLTGGGPGASALGASRSAAPVAPSSSAGPTEAAGAAGDVHITDTATWLATLEPALREAPAVDAAKVAAIRAAIEQGQYTVQPEHVAAQLMQIERALGQLRGSSTARTAKAAGSSEKP
jgi:negative regulator of flagellin synthesis FlgM